MASTIYSSQNFEDLEFYLKQFDEKKTSKDKVTSNLAIIHILLELELFDRANNRIQWHKDNIKDGYFDEKIKFYELLSLYQRGLINENISISDDFFNVQTILTGFINAEIKYKNNDFAN